MLYVEQGVAKDITESALKTLRL